MRNRIWNASGLLLGILTVAACAAPGPPPKELVDARLAIQDAKAAKADQLATHTYDSAAAHLDFANKSWEKDHDASAVLYRARLAEAEARNAQYAAETQMAEETIRRETNRKTRNDIAIRDAELLLLRAKERNAELERLKTVASEREQALLNTNAALTAEQARAARAEREALEAAKLREQQEKMAALTAEQARAVRAEREAARLREEQEKMATLTAEQARAESAEREAAKLREEQEKMRAELNTTLSRLAKVREEARGTIITLPGNIFFNVNKADVKPAMQEKLTEISKALAAVPEQYLLIEGHTDSDGPSEYNLILSEQRAQSVRSILLAGGIAPERIETKGYGQDRPVAPNSTAAGKAQNRRVEIVLQTTKES